MELNKPTQYQIRETKPNCNAVINNGLLYGPPLTCQSAYCYKGLLNLYKLHSE